VILSEASLAKAQLSVVKLALAGTLCVVTGPPDRLFGLWLLLFLGLNLLVDLQKVAARGTDHDAVVEATKPLDSLWHELLYKVDLRDDLWVAQATDDVDYDALQVVWVHEKLLRGDVVAPPEQVNLFAHLARAAVVNPLQLAHGAFETSQFLQVGNRQTVGLPRVDVRHVRALPSLRPLVI